MRIETTPNFPRDHLTRLHSRCRGSPLLSPSPQLDPHSFCVGDSSAYVAATFPALSPDVRPCLDMLCPPVDPSHERIRRQPAMSTTDNRKLITDTFTAWSRGDGMAFFNILADDVRWTVIGSTPVSRTYSSKSAFVEGAVK